jgi:glucan phosphorylase
MRILLDEEELSWDSAWTIVTNTFFFTNHTVLPVRLDNYQVGSLVTNCVLWDVGSAREVVSSAHGASSSEAYANHI